MATCRKVGWSQVSYCKYLKNTQAHALLQAHKDAPHLVGIFDTIDLKVLPQRNPLQSYRLSSFLVLPLPLIHQLADILHVDVVDAHQFPKRMLTDGALIADIKLVGKTAAAAGQAEGYMVARTVCWTS
jgi:hypothetical protein